jgi:hypothetical protein
VEHAPRGADRPIDMPDRAIAQAVGVSVVLFSSNICAGFSQDLQRLVNSPATIRVIVTRWMVIDILAVINCRLLDIADGRVNLMYSFLFVGRLGRISRPMLDQPTRRS